MYKLMLVVAIVVLCMGARHSDRRMFMHGQGEIGLIVANGVFVTPENFPRGEIQIINGVEYIR